MRSHAKTSADPRSDVEDGTPWTHGLYVAASGRDPMNIAFIDVTSTVCYGGVQTAVWELAIALTDLGHRVTIFGGDGDARPGLRGRSVDVRTFPFVTREHAPNFGSRFRRMVERWSFGRHARAAVAAGRFDWVVLTKPFDFFWPRILPAGAGTRFAFISGGTDFYAGDTYLAPAVDAWFACSHFNAWQIKTRYRRYPKVIYNGVDVGEFHPGRADPAIRAGLGLPEHELLLTFAGRLVGWKGLDIALRALAHPSLRALPAKLLLVGDGDALPRLRRLSQELGVGERVVFHPPVPHAELPHYYASSDIGVFPSIGDEAFGITIAEAMACALPVVASHSGGIPEVVGNEGSCGLLVNPGDPAALAQAIAALAGNAPRRRCMGEASARRVRGLFTWDMSARRMLRGLEDA